MAARTFALCGFLGSAVAFDLPAVPKLPDMFHFPKGMPDLTLPAMPVFRPEGLLHGAGGLPSIPTMMPMPYMNGLKEAFGNHVAAGVAEIRTPTLSPELGNKLKMLRTPAFASGELAYLGQAASNVLTYGKSTAGKRVRKEIRKLTSDEWADFVFALNEMKTKSQADGVSAYGPDFVTYDELSIQHATSVTADDCDRGHIGPALWTFHRLFMLRFEKSVLAITAKRGSTLTGVPYWDTMKDESKYEGFLNSDVLEMFGGEGDATQGYKITRGPFKDWEISEGPEGAGNERYRNAYGLMRAPWNPNPAKRITRRFQNFCGAPLPTMQHNFGRDCLKPMPTGLVGLQQCSDATVHATPHFSIGGSWESTGDIACIALQLPIFRQDQAIQALPYVSDWAKKCIVCPDSTCDPLTDGYDKCKCTYTAATREEAVHCTGNVVSGAFPEWGLGVLGDLADTAFSTNDPLFWVHHANLDRHFFSWQLVNGAQEFNNYGFPLVWSPGCYGQSLNDVVNSEFPFKGSLLGFTGLLADKDLTNKDAVQNTVPYKSLEYVYDEVLTM